MLDTNEPLIDSTFSLELPGDKNANENSFQTTTINLNSEQQNSDEIPPIPIHQPTGCENKSNAFLEITEEKKDLVSEQGTTINHNSEENIPSDSLQNLNFPDLLLNHSAQSDYSSKLDSLIICIFPFFFDSPLDEFENLNYIARSTINENSFFKDSQEKVIKTSSTNNNTAFRKEFHHHENTGQNTIKDQSKALFVDFFLVYDKPFTVLDSKEINSAKLIHTHHETSTNFNVFPSTDNPKIEENDQVEIEKSNSIAQPTENSSNEPQPETSPPAQQDSTSKHQVYPIPNSAPMSSDYPSTVHDKFPCTTQAEKTKTSETFCIPTTRIASTSFIPNDSMPNFCPTQLPLQCIPRSMACRLLPGQFPDARFIGACPINTNGTYPIKNFSAISSQTPSYVPDNPTYNSHNSFISYSSPHTFNKPENEINKTHSVYSNHSPTISSMDRFGALPNSEVTTLDIDRIIIPSASEFEKLRDTTDSDIYDQSNNLHSTSSIWSLRYSRNDGFIWEEISKLHHFGTDTLQRNIWTLEFLQIGSTWDYFEMDPQSTPQPYNLDIAITQFANQFPLLSSLDPSSEFESTLIQMWKKTPNGGSMSELPKELQRELSYIQNDFQSETIRDNQASMIDNHKCNHSPPYYMPENTKLLNESFHEYNRPYTTPQPPNSDDFLPSIHAPTPTEINTIQDVLGEIVDVFKDYNFVSALSQALEINDSKITKSADQLLDLSSIDQGDLSGYKVGNYNPQFLNSLNHNIQDKHVNPSTINSDYANQRIPEESLIHPWDVLKRNFSLQPTGSKLTKKFHNPNSPTRPNFSTPNYYETSSNIEDTSKTYLGKRSKRIIVPEVPSTIEGQSFNFSFNDTQQGLSEFLIRSQIPPVKLCHYLKLKPTTLQKFLNNQLNSSKRAIVCDQINKFLQKSDNKMMKHSPQEDPDSLENFKEPMKILESSTSRNSHKRSKLSGSVVWVHFEDCYDLDNAKQRVIRDLGYKYLHTGKTTNRYVRNYTCNRHKDCSARSRIVNDNVTGKVWIETLGSHSDNSINKPANKPANSTSTNPYFESRGYSTNNQEASDNLSIENEFYYTKREQ